MTRDRIPPNLLYFTIYNPTLHPSEPVDKDNEDAEEQAHILFYTAKERAVSRDRILRQVGLAKALVNFAEMFNPNDPCNNIHSQSRRMIMISPEPNFWIHAAVELARYPRPPPPKSKVKAKPIEKGKEKDPGSQFDYEDNPALDDALKADIMRGYHLFKLRHGSFTSILSRLGQAALELQMERFFTVWAWSWNLENGHDFSDQLGVPLHPAYPSLKPVMDTFTSSLPDNVHPIILSPPYAIPSTRFISERYPSSLTRHLTSVIPPEPSQESDLLASVETIKGKIPLTHLQRVLMQTKTPSWECL
ncbi:hypothetical protein BDQ17DRAFT_1467573 [Cyathus striatus]|nr:hypothetical protein BDQ17DRAFT_1467573 [Cyathus striatus]